MNSPTPPNQARSRMLLGIAVCSFSATPILLFVAFLRGLVSGESLEAVVEDFRNTEVVRLAFGYIITTLGVSPILAVIALVIRRMGKRGNDTWVRAIAAGSAVGFVMIVIVVSVILGEGPGWDSRGLLDMVAVMLVSVALSTLYWTIVVRPERERRALLREHAAEIRAME